MKLTRDRLKQIIKEELEEIMSVSEADIKVSVSQSTFTPEQLKSYESALKTYNGFVPVVANNGKKYFVSQTGNKNINVFDYNDNFIKYVLRPQLESGESPPTKPAPIQQPDPEVIDKAYKALGIPLPRTKKPITRS